MLAVSHICNSLSEEFCVKSSCTGPSSATGPRDRAVAPLPTPRVGVEMVERPLTRAHSADQCWVSGVESGTSVLGHARAQDRYSFSCTSLHGYSVILIVSSLYGLQSGQDWDCFQTKTKQYSHYCWLKKNHSSWPDGFQLIVAEQAGTGFNHC
jgi:hypothetical protein